VEWRDALACQRAAEFSREFLHDCAGANAPPSTGQRGADPACATWMPCGANSRASFVQGRAALNDNLRRAAVALDRGK